MMKKTVFVLTAMNIGGTEKALLNLLDTLSPEENDVTILLLKKAGGFLDEVPQWVKIQEVADYPEIEYEISTPPVKLVLQYLRSFRIVRAFGIAWRHLLFRLTKDRSGYYQYVLRGRRLAETFDTAIAFEGPADFVSTYVLDCVPANEKIQWIHFDVSKYLFHLRTAKRLYPQFNRIHVVSNEAKQALIGLLPEIAEKTVTVRNVISEKRCREMAMRGIGYTDDFSGTRILTVGRLSEEKGQDIIPEIANRLRESGLVFRWYIIGAGDLQSKIEAQITQLQLQDEVRLLGALTNPYPYFQGADIYVQTSIHEGFCITLAEAKAFELKVISTECLGAHEQLDKYAPGKIVERNIIEIARVILECVKGEMYSNGTEFQNSDYARPKMV